MAQYEDQSLLGKGANGEVRLVYNPLTQRHYALKKIPLQGTSPENTAKQAYISSMLPEHPNIVQLHDAEIVDEELYIYMEHVSGTDLGKHIREGGPLSVEESLKYFAQLMHGLDHAHTYSVAHGQVNRIYYRNSHAI
jgi:serine/threonine protein kinase